MKSAVTSPAREERLHALIAEYLDREAANQAPERSAWLAEHTAFADELRQFLDEHERVGRVGAPLRALAQPVGPNALTISTSADDTSRNPTVVRSFGDYELMREIARGGMGVVYKARQKSLNRVVALKMILAGQIASPLDVSRFQTEAQAAGQLDHPNIVPIYEVGEHEGQHFFSMKLVDGENLAQAIAADRWPRVSREGQRAIAQLIARAARAVHYAHQRGILHRDLKPANILLDDKQEPHVADFGLAKQVTGGSALTQTGSVVGTPSYMAPEQAAGGQQLTTAVDGYSLCAILYEMLAGQPPFRGESPLDVMLQVAQNEAAPPRSLNPALDRDLETICLKGLGKDPGHRYRAAEALADDLERWLSGEPIEARPSTAWERTAKWVRRRPAIAALVGVSLASAAALLIGGLFFNAELQLALGQVHDQKQDLQKAQGDLDQARGKVAEQEQEVKITKGQAKELLDEATSWRFAVRSEMVRPTNPGLGLLLALESAKLGKRGTEQNTALATLIQDCREQAPHLYGGAHINMHHVRYLAGGKRVVTVSYDSVHVWDSITGAKLLQFTGDGSRPNYGGLQLGTATVSPDDRYIALTFEGYRYYYFNTQKKEPIAITDMSARVFDLETGKEVQVLKGHEGRVTAVAFSKDGKRVATASLDGTARVWDLASGNALQALRGHQSGLRFVEFVTDDQVLTCAAGEKARAAPLEGKLPPERIDPPIRGPWGEDGISGGGTNSGEYGNGEEMFVCLWNADTGTKVKEFRTNRRGQIYGPRGAGLSEDRKILMSIQMDDVLFWDAASGKHIDSTQLKSSVLLRPIVPVRGNRALTVHRNNTVRVWDMTSGKEIAQLKGHKDSVTSARFSPDKEGRYVLTTSDDKTARLWETATGKELLVLRGHEASVNQGDFHPNGLQVVTTSNDQTTRFWNIRPDNDYARNIDPAAKSWWIDDDGESPANYMRNSRSIWSAFPSPDGKWIATGHHDGTLRLWETESNKLVWEAKPYSQVAKELRDQLAREIISISWSPEGDRILVVASDSVPRLERQGGGAEAEKRADVPYTPVRIYDAKTGAQLTALEGHFDGVRAAHWSPNGEQVLTVADDAIHLLIVNKAGQQRGGGSGGGKDRTARVFDAKSGKQLHVFTGDWKDIYSACWDPKGERVCTIHENFKHDRKFVNMPAIRVWNVKTGLEIHKLIDERNNVTRAAFTRDGRRLISWYDSRIRQNMSGSGTAFARVWDMATGKIVYSLTGRTNDIAQSPDGRWLATTAHDYNSSTSSRGLGVHGRLRDLNNFDRTVRLWDAETGAQVAKLYGHTQSAHDAVFSNDSRWVVTVSEDRTARIWNVAAGKEWITLRGHQDDVKSAQFTPDAKALVTTSWDGTARVWPTDPLPLARARRPRELTQEEKERFEVKGRE